MYMYVYIICIVIVLYLFIFIYFYLFIFNLFIIFYLILFFNSVEVISVPNWRNEPTSFEVIPILTSLNSCGSGRSHNFKHKKPSTKLPSRGLNTNV